MLREYFEAQEGRRAQEGIGVKIEEKLKQVDACCLFFEDEYFTVRSFLDDGTIKFQIVNRHDHKVVLHGNALKPLIRTLQNLLKELEK